MPDPVIRVRNLVKDYHGLRPLRLQEFDLQQGESVALLGFDQGMAEVLVNLLTGATLPDDGVVTVFGEHTRAIADPEAWVRTLDQFGLISERALTLDQLSTEQNLALPLSLQLETMSDEVRGRVRRLADEVGLGDAQLASRVSTLAPLDRQRLRLGRALALDPRVLLAEHPNAPLSGPDTRAFAGVFAQVVADRGLAAIVMTANAEFAAAISAQVLTLQPATGALKALPAWRRWLS